MLEEVIGYKFRNSLLLAEALTHPSLAYETQKPHFDWGDPEWSTADQAFGVPTPCDGPTLSMASKVSE